MGKPHIQIYEPTRFLLKGIISGLYFLIYFKALPLPDG